MGSDWVDAAADHIHRFIACRQAVSYLVALHQNLELLWWCACDWEGFNGKDEAVVFSDGNPFAGKLNRTYAALLRCRGQYEQGGLTGITFESMEAVE